MTSGEMNPGLSAERLNEAETDLARVREVLEAAGRGKAAPEQVKGELEGCLEQPGSVLRAAAAGLGEEARRQTLEELYKWRAQLRAHRETRRRTT